MKKSAPTFIKDRIILSIGDNSNLDFIYNKNEKDCDLFQTFNSLQCLRISGINGRKKNSADNIFMPFLATAISDVPKKGLSNKLFSKRINTSRWLSMSNIIFQNIL